MEFEKILKFVFSKRRKVLFFLALDEKKKALRIDFKVFRKPDKDKKPNLIFEEDEKKRSFGF